MRSTMFWSCVNLERGLDDCELRLLAHSSERSAFSPVNEVVAEPEVPRQIAKAALVIGPRSVEILRRIEVIALLNDGPSRALRRVLAILLVEVSSIFIKLPVDGERINTTPARRQLEAICFSRLNVFSRIRRIEGRGHRRG